LLLLIIFHRSIASRTRYVLTKLYSVLKFSRNNRDCRALADLQRQAQPYVLPVGVINSDIVVQLLLTNTHFTKT